MSLDAWALIKKDEESLVPFGVFHALRKLGDSGVLEEAESALAKQHYHWFNDNLKSPTQFTRSKSRAPYRKKRKAISWFKDTVYLRARLQSSRAVLPQLLRYVLSNDSERVWITFGTGNHSIDFPHRLSLVRRSLMAVIG